MSSIPRPPRLTPGNTIGIVTPSSPVDETLLHQGVQAIRERGYDVLLGEHSLARSPQSPYLAGTDAQRAGDLMSMYAHPAVSAVFLARGGYGNVRLLDRLDWERLAERPRILAGHSDATTLHLAVQRFSPMVTFFGPTVSELARLHGDAADVFWGLLEREQPWGTLPTGEGSRTLVSGVAQGPLTGGCLSLLAQACGTPYSPDFGGKIVIIEDVNEPPYRVDRNLCQLLHASVLQQAAGFVIGDVSWQRERPSEARLRDEGALEAVWQRYITPLGRPTVTGFRCGHTLNPLSLPMGVFARLEADEARLTLLESAVY